MFDMCIAYTSHMYYTFFTHYFIAYASIIIILQSISLTIGLLSEANFANKFLETIDHSQKPTNFPKCLKVFLNDEIAWSDLW